MVGIAQTARIRLQVDGMDCASCAAKIETALQRLPGVSEVAVSVPAGTVTVTRAKEAHENIRNQISNLGYRVTRVEEIGVQNLRHKEAEGTPSHPDEAHSHIHNHSSTLEPWWQTRKGILTIASGAALAVAFLFGKFIPATERWAFLLAMLVGLIPIARRAFSAARAGTPFSIEMLMTIAAVGAVFIGVTEEAATVVFLFLIGELLEGVAASRARASIQELTKLVPKTALFVVR